MSQFQPGRGSPYEQVPRKFSKWELIADQVIRATQTGSLIDRTKWLHYACSMLDETERQAMQLNKPLPNHQDAKTPLELLDDFYVSTIVEQGMIEQLVDLRNQPHENVNRIFLTDGKGRRREITTASPEFQQTLRSQLEQRIVLSRLLGFIVEKLARYAEGQGVRVSVPASILGPDGRPIARTILKGDSVQFPAEDQQKPQQDKKPHEDK